MRLGGTLAHCSVKPAMLASNPHTVYTAPTRFPSGTSRSLQQVLTSLDSTAGTCTSCQSTQGSQLAHAYSSQKMHVGLLPRHARTSLYQVSNSIELLCLCYLVMAFWMRSQSGPRSLRMSMKLVHTCSDMLIQRAPSTTYVCHNGHVKNR